MSMMPPDSARRIAIAPLLVACGTLAAAACGAGAPEDEARWSGTIDTLASGAVHVRNGADAVWPADGGVTIRPELRIGAMEGGGPDVFGQVRDLDVDPLGRIYVLDNQAKEVRVFTPDGAHLRTLGGPGAGPGEFENPNGMGWDAVGRLWVSDPRNARYSVFDTAGTFLTTYPRDVPGWGYRWSGWFDDDGALYVRSWRLEGRSARESVIVRLDSTATPLDTFPAPTAGDRERLVYELTEDGVTRMAAGVPFSPTLQWLVDRQGTVWSAFSDDYRLHRRAMAGDTLRIVERAHEPVPVTPEEREVALQSEFIQDMRDAGAEIDPGRVPENKPVFQGFTLDDDGYLWVTATTADTTHTTFDIFDPQGRFLGRTDAGAKLSLYPPPVVRRDAIYAVVQDEFDVQYIVRLGIEWPSAEEVAVEGGR